MPTEPPQSEISQMPHIDSTGGDMFVSVEERERLMRAPLDSVRSDKRIRTRTKSQEERTGKIKVFSESLNWLVVTVIDVMVLHELIESFAIQCSCCGVCDLSYHPEAIWVYLSMMQLS